MSIERRVGTAPTWVEVQQELLRGDRTRRPDRRQIRSSALRADFSDRRTRTSASFDIDVRITVRSACSRLDGPVTHVTRSCVSRDRPGPQPL